MAKYTLAVGKLSEAGYDWLLFAPPAKEDKPQDDERQRLIDEAQMTLDYEDDMLDREDWARGQW